MKTEENDKIQDRREFFKQAAKKTLPVLAIAPILQSCDTALLVLEAMAEASTQYQNSQPKSTYTPSSSYSNSSGCGTCSSACNNSCIGTCRGNCSSGCSGGCSQNCSKSCTGNCHGTCKGECVNGCKGTCTMSCANSCYFGAS